jgi:hypothetical protein
MATAMRCSLCGISYPPGYTHCLLPDCQGSLWAQFKDGPDDDWQELVAEKAGVPILYSAVHPPNGRCEVREYHGHWFVKHDDLITLGYQALEGGSIIRINEVFYELAGYSQSTGYWWVEVIEIEGAAEELHPAMFERWDGQES